MNFEILTCVCGQLVTLFYRRIKRGIGLWKVKFEYGCMSVKIDLVVRVDRQVFLFSNSSSCITGRR